MQKRKWLLLQMKPFNLIDKEKQNELGSKNQKNSR